MLKNRNPFWLTGGILLFWVFCLSCSGKKEFNSRNQVYLPYVMSTAPDPYNIVWSGDWAACNHGWATLVDYNGQGEITPVLAESWTRSIDGLNWTFVLKKNLKWSDGTTMTDDQFQFSLNAARAGTTHTDFSEIVNNILVKEGKVKFFLKKSLPTFLMHLSYIDWAIVHPNSIKIDEKSGKVSVSNLGPCSGSYCLDLDRSQNIVHNIGLKRNEFSVYSQQNLPATGELRYFDSCAALTESSNQMVSFRSYSEVLNPECMSNLKLKGFKINRTYPNWVLGAYFTKAGAKHFGELKRRYLLVRLQKALKENKLDFGVSRATGIRPIQSLGALNIESFDELVTKFEGETLNIDLKGTKIRLTTMELWANWRSYKWLVSQLKNIGLKVESIILSKQEFGKALGTGSLQTDFDLYFMPLGSGDIDPDGNWRIAHKLFFSEIIEKAEITSAFFESDQELRMNLYSNLARKVLAASIFLPLVYDADYVGFHESVKGTNAPPFRQGLTLYDVFY